MIKIELSKYQVGLILEDLESEMRHISDNYYHYKDTWDSPEWEKEYNEREELYNLFFSSFSKQIKKSSSNKKSSNFCKQTESASQ